MIRFIVTKIAFCLPFNIFDTFNMVPIVRIRKNWNGIVKTTWNAQNRKKKTKTTLFSSRRPFSPRAAFMALTLSDGPKANLSSSSSTREKVETRSRRTPIEQKWKSMTMARTELSARLDFHYSKCLRWNRFLFIDLSDNDID